MHIFLGGGNNSFILLYSIVYMKDTSNDEKLTIKLSIYIYIILLNYNNMNLLSTHIHYTMYICIWLYVQPHVKIDKIL